PEHPAQCSFERKKLYYRPPFKKWPTNLNEVKRLFKKSEDNLLDNDESVQETAIIVQNVHDEPSK
ncbi:3758_t:CDS:1, partial [Gigaspora margarita]